MNAVVVRELPSPEEIKDMLPLPSGSSVLRDKVVSELKSVLGGVSDKLILLVGPCSADREDAVLDYMTRLRKLRDEVRESIVIIPRVYTNKPRTAGVGYKGMLHQPDSAAAADLYNGLLASRRLHLKLCSETEFFGADELLYPELYPYCSDLLAYSVVGARSVENQQHRMVASGMNLPVGMKNPMCGYNSVLLNSIKAAQSGHDFIYRNQIVSTNGNEFAHAILRGYLDNAGCHHQNCSFEALQGFVGLCQSSGLKNPAVIVDCNHSNSGKDCLAQGSVAKDVMKSRRRDFSVGKIVKGLMIESYLEDGCQKPGEGVYGRSVTDPCLGWEKTERLIYELADLK